MTEDYFSRSFRENNGLGMRLDHVCPTRTDYTLLFNSTNLKTHTQGRR